MTDLTYVHGLTFETKEQAELAASHLHNVERLCITDVFDIVSYFVDVPSAFALQFHTPSPLDEDMQAVLSNQVGIIAEMSATFNLDAAYEDAIASIIEEAEQWKVE